MTSSSYFCEAWDDNRECIWRGIVFLFRIPAVLFGYGIVNSHIPEVNIIIYMWKSFELPRLVGCRRGDYIGTTWNVWV